MLCSEIIQVIEASYPKSAALGFDNVGLLVEEQIKKRIRSIWRWMRRMR